MESSAVRTAAGEGAADARGPRVMVLAAPRMFAEAICAVLQRHEIDVIDTRGDADVVDIARRTPPSLVVVDLETTGDGVSAARKIVDVVPEVRLMGLAATGDDGAARRAMSAGFHGCITKDVAAEALVAAIHAVSNGQRVAPEWLARHATRSWITEHHEEFLIAQLTPRELEIIGMIAAAMRSEHIAAVLFISVNTVRSHIQSIFSKLQVHSRLEAVAFASRNGLLHHSAPAPAWRSDEGPAGAEATGS
jgi:two-component system nitrate/nitrite response regulator NarL